MMTPPLLESVEHKTYCWERSFRHTGIDLMTIKHGLLMSHDPPYVTNERSREGKVCPVVVSSARGKSKRFITNFPASYSLRRNETAFTIETLNVTRQFSFVSEKSLDVNYCIIAGRSSRMLFCGQDRNRWPGNSNFFQQMWSRPSRLVPAC